MFGLRRGLHTASSVALATALIGGLAACDPPPPRPSLVVTTQLDGHDSAAGDGVCASATAGGECTLRAAFDEGNALGNADITVPAGDYRAGEFSSLGLSVTGDLRLNWGVPQAVGMLGVIDVRPGGVLFADGLRRIPSVTPLNGSLTLEVEGVLWLRGGVLSQTPRATTAGSEYIALDVAAGAAAVIDRSVISGWTSAVRSAGLVLAADSAFLSAGGSTLDVQDGGQAYLRASVLTGAGPSWQGGCSGTPPVSLGFVHSDTPCLPALGQGDAVGTAELSYATFSTFQLAPTSPLIDAIPLGVAGCPVAAVDINGNPRAVDGDGDGVVACDVGPVEHQPAP